MLDYYIISRKRFMKIPQHRQFKRVLRIKMIIKGSLFLFIVLMFIYLNVFVHNRCSASDQVCDMSLTLSPCRTKNIRNMAAGKRGYDQGSSQVEMDIAFVCNTIHSRPCFIKEVFFAKEFKNRLFILRHYDS